MENVIVILENDTLSFPHGMYRVGANVYQINSMGVFRTDNFGTKKLFGGNIQLSNEDRLVGTIELRGLYRAIMK